MTTTPSFLTRTVIVAVLALLTSAPVTVASSRSSKERAIRLCVNDERRARGLVPLQYDADLSRAARLHADDMRNQGFFDHQDPQGRGPSERVALFTDRFFGAGENIYAGPRTASAACLDWMASPGHRANFLEPDYRFFGTGFAAGGRWGTYWVQDFAYAPEAADAQQ